MNKWEALFWITFVIVAGAIGIVAMLTGVWHR